jgi:hypothetical protein
VLDAWWAVGVSGTTLFESRGLAHVVGQTPARDDLPLFPTLRNLLSSREEPHVTLMAAVPDGFDVDRLVSETEKITGVLDTPETGIVLVVPVRRAWGLRRALP